MSAQLKLCIDRWHALEGPQGNALAGKQIGIVLTEECFRDHWGHVAPSEERYRAWVAEPELDPKGRAIQKSNRGENE
jgi:hypothetical protein